MRYAIAVLAVLLWAPFCAAQDFTFELPDMTVETDVGEFTVTMRISEDPDGDDFPNAVKGFSTGISCDPDILAPMSISLTEFIQDLNDGDGPEFLGLGVAADDEGFVAHMVFGLVFDVTLELVDEEVLELTLEVGPDVDMVELPVESTLEFTSELSFPAPEEAPSQIGPPIENLVAVEITLYTPELEDGVITLIEPKAEVPEFIRGDVNGDGTTSVIPDALFLLRWQFTRGDEPPCMDAADVDDSGTVSAIADALFLLKWQFSAGDEPPAPGPEECGEDPDDGDDVAECETPPEACASP